MIAFCYHRRMGQVLIRNLDDETIAAYREAAARSGRSLEAELRDLLTRLRPASAVQAEEFRKRARQIREMTPDIPQTPGWVLVREDRDGYREA
jgi:antitoxin FitA